MRYTWLFFLLLPLSEVCVSQTPETRARWIALEEDSIRVEYHLPDTDALRPVVLVLSDRYGQQANVRATLNVLSTLGFRAYSMPLRSAPEQSFSTNPSARVDSSDIARVLNVAVELMNEDGSNGRLKLLAFDIGANVGMEVVARFPFFKGAALFYPVGGVTALKRLLDARCPLLLHVAQYDPDCTLADVNVLREEFMERGKKLQVYYYKDSRRFFFNPEHPDYHSKNTQSAWTQLHQFFRQP